MTHIKFTLLAAFITFFGGIQCFSQFSPLEKLTANIDGISAQNIQSISSGDFDNDGDLDIVYLNYPSSGTIGAFLCENFGEFNFGKPELICALSAPPRDIQVTDIDADGLLDVVIGTFGDDILGWCKNLNNLNFGPRVTISNQLPYLNSFEMADFDNDGDMDFLNGQFTDSTIVIIENLSLGNFAPIDTILSNYIAPQNVKARDMDNDGDIDIIVGSYDIGNSSGHDSLSYLENLGGFNFGPKQVIANIFQTQMLEIADINGDGLEDVVISNSGDSIFIVPNLGLGNFGIPYLVNSSLPVQYSYGLIDFEGDGDLDIITKKKYGSFKQSVLYNDGLGNFSSPVDKFSYYNGIYHFEDFNNDGKKDLLLNSGGGSNLILRENLGGGSYGNQQALISFSLPYGEVDHADIDNDGHEDLVMSSDFSHIITWIKYFSNSSNLFGQQRYLYNDFEVTKAAFGDIDGDGLDDIVSSITQYTSNTEYKIFYHKNLGNGHFDTLSVLLNYVDATEIILLDVDGDGDNDMVFTDATMTSTYWSENTNGLGSFANPISISGYYQTELQSIDFDMDGDIDIISGQCYMTNQGNSTFVTTVFQVQGNTFLMDKNSDGLVDRLIVDNPFVGFSLKVFLNIGNGFETSPSSVIPLSMPPLTSNVKLAAANLNDDLYEDLIILYQTNNASSFYDNIVYMTAANDTSFNQQQTLSYNPTPPFDGYSITAFDVDSDGDDEIFFETKNAGSSDQGVNVFYNETLNAVQLKGRLFVDTNQNGQNDPTDLGCPIISINSLPQSDFAYTYGNGNYILNLSDSLGSYGISPSLPQHWSLSTDSAVYNVLIDTSFYQLDSLDFGIKADTLFYKASSSLTGGFPRCNQINNHWLNVKNAGTLSLNGIIKLTLDDSLTYVSSAVTPDSIIGNELYWTLGGLNVFQDSLINFQVLMPDFNSLNDTIITTTEIIITDSAGSQLTFIDSLSQKIVCAYDPNDKIVLPKGKGSNGEIPFEITEFDYTIRFQNTGNDTAIVVKIEDQLSSNLDFQSLEFIASSHEVKITVDQNGKATFLFDNIMLPDSNVNELGSQGFIRYKITRLPNLPVGTEIYNTGHIFFDQNPAVITNSVQNTLSCSTYNTSINYNGDTAFCVYDDPIVFVNETPIGGLYSGSGVSGNQFSPSILTDSLNTIYYTYTNSHNCILIDSIVLTNASVSNVSINYFGDSVFCDYDTPITFTNELPTGGIFSGDGMTGNQFIPMNSLSGLNTIYYTYTNQFNCVLTDSLQIINSSAQPASINYVDTVLLFCNYHPPVNLNQAIPSGGTFSGSTGLTGQIFNPNMASLGVNNILYTYTNSYGCISQDSIEFIVDGCLGLSELNSFRFSAYPNPFKDEIHLEWDETYKGEYEIQLTNLLGQKLLTTQIQGVNEMTINGRNLAEGTVILSLLDILTGEKLIITRLTVLK